MARVMLEHQIVLLLLLAFPPFSTRTGENVMADDEIVRGMAQRTSKRSHFPTHARAKHEPRGYKVADINQ